MALFALLVHHDRPEAITEARDLAEWLGGEGHQVVLPTADAQLCGLDELAQPLETIAGRADLAVSLGGDGSILRAVAAVANAGVPVLGINFGHLGYLTQVEPAGVRHAVTRWLEHDFSIEERMRVSITTPDGTCHQALNEIVVEKLDGRTIEVAVSIGHEHFHTYETDGVIVATPTGSTAYSLSARGPIVDPTHEALVLTPVAPHTLFDRSLVLAPDVVVGLAVEGQRPAGISIDGVLGAHLEPGQSVQCIAAAEPARLVTFGTRNFHRIIKSKFDLNQR
ncbi:MAG: NAD(+)/NADH kinase [Acidimicrobiia bacterium]|nr:NAD(+)/NADH kinase [Acidimicrobiia bacterium]